MISPDILKNFQTIPLDEMGKVKLMNRIDTKFVTSALNIEKLLERIQKKYLLQEIADNTNMPYYSKYFDTKEADMYYQHHRGKKSRQKIRIRLYEGTNEMPFLEVKNKNNKGRTQKKRILMEEGGDLLKYDDFISDNSLYSTKILFPRIENHFYRLTLVNPEMTERITIDTEISFNNLINNVNARLKNVGIIEWKRDNQSDKSKFGQIIREFRIGESGFSKYCMGLAMTDPNLSHGRFNKKLRMISKIENYKK